MATLQRAVIRLDPQDPKYQEMRFPGLPPIKVTVEQAKKIAAILTKNLPEQERHAAGARIVIARGTGS